MAQGPAAAKPDVSSRVFTEGMRILWIAIRTEPWVFSAAVAGAVLYAVAAVASASVLGAVAEQVILPAIMEQRTTVAAVATASAVVFAVGFLKALGLGARRFYAGLMQYRMQARYRRAVARRYLELPLAWHQRHPAGQLLSNANADVEATWQPLAPLPMAVGSTAMLVIAAGAMLATDLVLALVGFVVFPLLAIANLVFQRRVSPAATHAQALRSQVSEVAHESFDGALVVKTLGREDMETERFTRAAERLRDAQIRVGRMRAAFDPLLEALPNLGVLVVLLIGLIRLQRGDVTAGDIVQIAYLFTLLSLPIRSLGWLLGDLPRSVVGWRRVSAVLNAQGGTDYGKERLHGEGGLAVSVRNLSFSYADTSPADLGRDTLEGGRGLDATGNEETPRITVLRDVTLDLAPGKVTALVGPTGSGKSTLTMLLARLVDPDHGDVLVNGVDARRYAPGELARAIALVPQTTFIFDDTVRDNITLGLDVDDTEVWQALRLAHADSFVAALPQGLDTRLGERGTSLSGGQRQRLALARSLVRRPRLLILDDATSAVDPQVEARILGGLREADLAGATVVVVAYRRATIELADEVVYLEQGTVRDRGTHEELLARSPGYRRLVTAYEQAAQRRAAAASRSADQEAVR
ncbi:MAG: ABC transporter ATP-binding protein [Thermobifida fusca]|jgi:ATP-binding cassette, subfamily B, bacterial|nr:MULTISPECIES: ABC transporter ATP-binding protein [Thermobifida]MBO2530684.1 ABC transporter ATP-binding protein [Thermobifida sp.]PPS91988.1 ABC transporter permease [Thermobifida fusca]PZN64298.1 MAG: ABC transporter ATP-binding protein [Thermobifida fusca]